MRMKRAGRVNILTVAVLACVVVIFSMFFIGRENIGSVGAKFMSALAKGDVDTLTDLSYLGNKDKEDMKKQWEFAAKDVSKQYTFEWRVTGARELSEKAGSVSLMVSRNLFSGSTYEEKFELPMIRVNGRWLVNVSGISRDMYPALPR
jgi:hypothetical protein